MLLLSDIPRGEKVLLHICCAPDASYGVRALGELFDVIGYFYNPNIHPVEEHRKRVQATLDLREKAPFPLIVGSGGEADWEEAVRGLEGNPNGAAAARHASCSGSARRRGRPPSSGYRLSARS